MNRCIRCKKLLDKDYDNKTCEKCIEYINEELICERCGCSYQRTKRNRHYRSYKCRMCIFIEI